MGRKNNNSYLVLDLNDKAQIVGVSPSWVMCDRSVMILESFFLLLGGAGVPDRGMILGKQRSEWIWPYTKTHPCLVYVQ